MTNKITTNVEAEIKKHLMPSNFRFNNVEPRKLNNCFIQLKTDLSNLIIDKDTEVSFYGEGQFAFPQTEGEITETFWFDGRVVVDEKYNFVRLLQVPYILRKK